MILGLSQVVTEGRLVGIDRPDGVKQFLSGLVVVRFGRHLATQENPIAVGRMAQQALQGFPSFFALLDGVVRTGQGNY